VLFVPDQTVSLRRKNPVDRDLAQFAFRGARDERLR
jgi:hypothetical protein